MNKTTSQNREHISDIIHKSYDIPEQNLQPYKKETKSNLSTPGISNHIRGNEISLKGDKNTKIKISLEDHDEAVLYHIINNIQPAVEINDFMRSIPVIYASPERFKSMQKDGFYRDKNGKIQCPLIAIKRDSFEKVVNIGNKLDGNKVNNIQYIKTGYSQRNSYMDFDITKNRKPSIEYQTSIIPDYININYKIVIFCDYVEHMNRIIESFEYASDSFWGDKERWLFYGKISSYPTPITVDTGNDRVSRSELSLTINGYIIPETINKYISSPSSKSFNITNVVFKENI